MTAEIALTPGDVAALVGNAVTRTPPTEGEVTDGIERAIRQGAPPPLRAVESES